MRIIAGLHRGRRLAAPRGLDTRPMLDRVREALFSTLGDRLEDARVLDLFAGSGSLGLESLSRGARAARLVERGKPALAVLRENVAALGEEERAEVVAGDALDPASWGSEPCDVAFLDPPYPLLERPGTRKAVFAALARLVERGLTDGGVVVFHTPARGPAAGDFGDGLSAERRTYGSSALWYVEPAAAGARERAHGPAPAEGGPA